LYSRNILTKKTIVVYLAMGGYFGAFAQMRKATLNFVMKKSRDRMREKWRLAWNGRGHG